MSEQQHQFSIKIQFLEWKIKAAWIQVWHKWLQKLCFWQNFQQEIPVTWALCKFPEEGAPLQQRHLHISLLSEVSAEMMNLLSSSNWVAEKQWVIWLIPLVSRWWYYQSEQQQQSWMSQHHQQQQFSFVVSDLVAILNASLSCIGTQISINLAPSLRLEWPILIQLDSVSANWPLPRCVRDHKVYVDDSCC